jgi:hypothetical protein
MQFKNTQKKNIQLAGRFEKPDDKHQLRESTTP